ncbi:MAG: 16S rRNA (guanine(966)-N(2))-methyltransferase RsmD [Thermoanaerobaculia bacterium]|nr:16S rRNA (guanine(966)-N(2))-methyltransferase RsmD [Thermoanaerobaculia bacterium]
MIRIVAGEYRGRRLGVGPGVRPTTERAREALFSILGDRVRGARVLDAAAGSGALGFEALSRGAASAVFVEADRRVARTLEANVALVGAGDRAVVVARPVAAFLRIDRPSGFDLVFFDPPWAEPVASELGGLWSAVSPGGTFVLERESGGDDPWPEAPRTPTTRRYGTTTLYLYSRPIDGQIDPDGADAAEAGEDAPRIDLDPAEK